MKRACMILFAAFMILSLCSCGSSPEAAEPTPKPLPSVEECEAKLAEAIPAARTIHVQREEDYDGLVFWFDTESEFDDFSRFLLDSMYACMSVYGKNDYIAIVTVVDRETNESKHGSFMPDYEGEFCEVFYQEGEKIITERYETIDDFLTAYPTITIK